MEETVSISRLQIVIGFTMHVGLMRMHSARATTLGSKAVSFCIIVPTPTQVATLINSYIIFSHLWMFPDIVVRAHQVTQQNVELLLFRHCSEIQKDQPKQRAASRARWTVTWSHTISHVSLVWFTNSSGRWLDQTLRKTYVIGPSAVLSNGKLLTRGNLRMLYKNRNNVHERWL